MHLNDPSFRPLKHHYLTKHSQRKVLVSIATLTYVHVGKVFTKERILNRYFFIRLGGGSVLGSHLQPDLDINETTVTQTTYGEVLAFQCLLQYPNESPPVFTPTVHYTTLLARGSTYPFTRVPRCCLHATSATSKGPSATVLSGATSRLTPPGPTRSNREK